MYEIANLQKNTSTLQDWNEERTSPPARRNEEELMDLKSKQRYSERLSAISHFTTRVASELNDCLTPIICYAQVVAQYPEAERFREKLQKIVQAANQAKRIMDGLMDFSCAQPIVQQEVNLDSVIRETVPLARDLLWLEKEDIQYDENPDLPHVLGDPNQIVQALLHLIRNAHQAQGEERKPIVVRAFQLPEEEKPDGCIDPNPYVVVEVEDQGDGIPQAELPKILLPFFTTHHEDAIGLGLSIVYGIIDSHGGDLEIYSEDGSGTRVRIVLPTRKLPPRFKEVP